jgi:hypothetical protein
MGVLITGCTTTGGASSSVDLNGNVRHEERVDGPPALLHAQASRTSTWYPLCYFSFSASAGAAAGENSATGSFHFMTIGPLGTFYEWWGGSVLDKKGEVVSYDRTWALVWGVLWYDSLVKKEADDSSTKHKAGLLWSGFGYGQDAGNRTLRLLWFSSPIGKAH